MVPWPIACSNGWRNCVFPESMQSFWRLVIKAAFNEGMECRPSRSASALRPSKKHNRTYHNIPLHYIALQYMALHYTPLHYITLQYSTEHAMTSHNIPSQYITLHYITGHYSTPHTIFFITLHHITLQYIWLQHITLHFITLHYISLHYITSRYITLRYTPLHYTTWHTSTLHTYIPTHLHTYIPACIHRDMHTHAHSLHKRGVKRYRQTDRDRQTDINTCTDDHGCMQALCHACTYTQGRMHRHMYIEHACQHGLGGIAGRLNGTDFFPLLIVLWVQGGDPSNWHVDVKDHSYGSGPGSGQNLWN